MADLAGGCASSPPATFRCSSALDLSHNWLGNEPESLLVFLPSCCEFVCFNFPSPEMMYPRGQWCVEQSFKWGRFGWEVELFGNTSMLSQVTEPRSDEAGVALWI